MINNNFSLTALKIEMLGKNHEDNSDILLSKATAFFYCHLDKVYLVTNKHNILGKNVGNGNCLSNTGCLPYKIRIFFPVEVLHQNNKAITWQPRDLCLYKIENEEYIPIWLESIKIPEIDIAIIPFDETIKSLKQMGIAIIPVNSTELDLTDFEIKAGMDAFLLGYPLGLVGGGHLPIWKRGSIASEYMIDIEDLPKYFIDTATTKTGMSGSPVFIKSDGITLPKSATSMNDMILGSCYIFGGIYSGRSQLTHNGEVIFPDLAIVWKEKAITQIIENETVSTYKFYG